MVVQNLPVPFDRRVWQEAQALANCAGSVTVICPSDSAHPPGGFKIDGIQVRRYAAPPEGNTIIGYIREYASAITAIRRESRIVQAEKEVHVVHICNPPDLLFIAVRHLTKNGTPLIFDQHDLGPELVEAKHMRFPRLLHVASRIAERLTYRAADHVISTNNSYRSIAVTRGRKNPDEVTVVRSGPNRDWIKQGEKNDAWRRGHQHMIGYVGVIGRQDGLQYLLEAVKHLVDWNVDVNLSVVGSGPDLPRLKTIVNSLGLADNVDFLGRLSNDELRSVLETADVCVNPDEVNKMNDLSTMNKILEYMALGKPVVQFDVMEGRYSAGCASRYATPNDAKSLALEIRWVLENRPEAVAMGQEAKRRFAEELSWESQVPSLLRAYEAVLKKPNEAQPIP